MTSKDFAYWLQGLFELGNIKTLDERQVDTIKNHLKLVFLHEIDPSYSDDPTVQKIFQNIHDGKKPLDGIDITKVKPRTDWSSNRDNLIVKC
jgi:hypothetical protein